MPPRRTTNHRVRRSVLAALPIVLVMVSLVMAFVAEPALAGRKRTYRLKKGVTLTNISRRGPVKIRCFHRAKSRNGSRSSSKASIFAGT